jgi:N-acyl-D-amino-acid deacylase
VNTWVLKGGTVVDGHGRAGPGTVVVQGERVREVLWGQAVRCPAGEILDAGGLVVAPGFIDAHSHDDVAATLPSIYEGKLRQGVTSSLVGLDGLGYAPLDPVHRDDLVRYWKPVDGDPGAHWSARLKDYGTGYQGRLGLNVALGMPHANARLLVAGFANRALSPAEMRAAAQLVADGLQDGAYGVTTGLSYVPAHYSDLDELLQMLAPLRRSRRPYVTHLRAYGAGQPAALEEALAIGRGLQVPVHLSHFRITDPARYGQAPDLIEQLVRLWRDQDPVSWDTYPYQAGSSILHSYLPPWVAEGGPDALLARLRRPETLERLAADPAWHTIPWDRVVIAFTRSGRAVGQAVTEVAAHDRVPVIQAVRDLLEAEDLEVGCVVHQSHQADDDVLATAPWAMVGSDGIPFGQRPHPRYFGAFAAYFARHVRKRRAVTIAEAVEAMSTRAARRFGLTGRGVLEPGGAADVVAFDPARLEAHATYEAPRQPATGVVHVLVNGVPVIRDGAFDPDVRPGRVLTVRQS